MQCPSVERTFRNLLYVFGLFFGIRRSGVVPFHFLLQGTHTGRSAAENAGE